MANTLPVCKHFHNVKKEKFSNNLQSKKNANFCDELVRSKCDPDSEKWLCIECCFVGCSRNSVQQCSLKHYNSSQHKVVISLSSQMIWCYGCDDDLDSMIEAFEDEISPLVEKMTDFASLIKQQLYNFQKLRTVHQQPKKIDKQEDQPQKEQVQFQTNPLPYTPTKVFGLKNLGNTCFFNSVMQCLNGAQPLIKFYLDLAKLDFSHKDIVQIQQQETTQDDGWSTVEDVVDKKKKQQQQNYKKQQTVDTSGIKLLNTKYQQFLVQSRRSKNNIHDPSDLFKAVSVIHSRFRSMAQQDASELLRCFLDALSTGEEKVMKAQGESVPTTEGKAKYTVVENVFGSYLCNYLECLDCGHISRTFDFCLDLAVQISKPKQNVRPPHLRNPLISQISESNPKQQTESTDIVKNDNNEEEEQITKDDKSNGIGNEQTKSESNKNIKSSKKNKNKKKKNKKQENQTEESNSNQNSNEKLKRLPVELQVPDQVQDEISDNNNIIDEKQDQIIIKYDDYSFVEIPQKQLDNEKIPYFDHSLNVLYQQIDNLQSSEQISSKANNLTLKECLDSFTEFETLNLKNNYFKCENCSKKNKKSTCALRKFYLYDSPPVLTIVLKRFSQKSSVRFEKVVEHVEFSEYLDIGKYILPKGYVNQTPEEVIEGSLKNQIYKLFGVVVHSGSMAGGHYIAYVRHREQNEDHWYYYSDTSFKEVSLKQVLSAQAYILFYEKCAPQI